MSQELAQLMGANAIEIFVILLLVVLFTIVGLWRLFEMYYPKVGELGGIVWRYITGLSFVQSLRQRYPRIWSFLEERLSPDNYLGIHLTLGLLLSLAALNIFADITGDVVEQDDLTQFDQALATALYQNATLDQVAVFKVITDLGDMPVLAAVGLAVGVMLLIRRRWLLLISWGITLAGGALLNVTLKAIFQRVRPEFDNPFVDASGWSFPSGHAMIALITYGMLAYLLVLVVNRYLKQIMVVATVSLVLLIGFSRLYLGVHYFSDVVAGYAAGTVWLAVSISGTEIARRRQRMQLSPQPSLAEAPGGLDGVAREEDE